MDLTYVFSGLIGIMTGAVVGSFVVVAHLRMRRAALLVALLLALAIQAMLTVHWHGLTALMTLHPDDLLLITLYALLGCVAGGLPPVAARGIWRIRNGGSKDKNSH